MTVTTEDVRAAWIAWHEPGDERWSPEQFDRWLADHDREIQAELRRAVNVALPSVQA